MNVVLFTLIYVKLIYEKKLQYRTMQKTYSFNEDFYSVH